jgi:hypothetical protein
MAAEALDEAAALIVTAHGFPVTVGWAASAAQEDESKASEPSGIF